MRSSSRSRRVLVGVAAVLTVVAIALVVMRGPLRRALHHLPAVASETATQETRFGCNPGPTKPPPPQNPMPPIRPASAPADAYLLVDGRLAGPPIAGVGFNIEPTLWTCPSAAAVIEQRIFDTFQPPLIRIGLAQAPWVPEDVDSADDLTWDVYQRVLDSPAFQPSWDFIAMLNRRGITPIVSLLCVPAPSTEN